MRILVGWDSPEEADLISLYLSIDDNQVTIVTDADELRQQAKSATWDIAVLSTSLPDQEQSFELFQEFRRLQPDCPVVGACRSREVFRLVRFITNGMRSYILRDVEGDWVFLLQANLESVLHAVKAEREQLIAAKLREEMESVRQLQATIIPRELDSPPGYRICARYETSQLRIMGGRPVTMAGGDYYDVFRIGEESTVVLVGDASGHGMKACMSILTMHTLVRMIRNNRYDHPADFVAAINKHLCEQSVVSEEGGFITLLYGILNASRGEFQWSSAGHPIPLLQDLGRDVIEPIGSNDAGGLPLGITDGVDYETHTVQIPLHSRLLLYTDGLAEAFPGDQQGHEEFGLDGILRTMKESREVPLEDALEALFQRSHEFTQGAGRHDDTSIVLLERDGS